MARVSIEKAATFTLVGALVVIIYQHAGSLLAGPLEAKKAQVTSPQEKRTANTFQRSKMSKEIGNVPAEILEEMLKLNAQKVSHDNPRLVTLIREYFIHPPSKEPYNLTEPISKRKGQHNTLPKTLSYIPDKSFFVECGAYDGEGLSHSLYFEKTKHWSGLLIEANLHLFKRLLQKHRKAYSINACLSSHPYPSVMTFNQLDAIGRLVEGTFDEAYNNHQHFKPTKHMIQLQCFPLYSVLLALNQVHVDLFSLDIEGMELPILRTIPWDKVNITHIMAEFSHSEGGQPPSYKRYFEQNGYKFMRVIGEDILVQRKQFLVSGRSTKIFVQ